MLQGMRNFVVHASSNQKLIEDYHGAIFTVPASTIEKCDEFFQTIDDFDNCDFEASDIWDPLFSSRFPKSDISFFQTKATDTPLSKEILKAAFECITPFFEKVKSPEEKSEKIKAIIKSISKDQIRSIFSVVNYLGPQKAKVAKKLTHRMKELIPRDELKKDNEIDVIILSGSYDKTIEKLLKKKGELEFDNPRARNSLDFRNMRIGSLKGIENITRKDVKLLYLNNNALTTLDVESLIQQLPKLMHVNVSNCNIITLILPKHLSKHIEINLENNDIRELPTFFVNGKCTINLKGNPLSEDAHEKIRRALIPPFLKRNQHYFYLLGYISILSTIGSIAGGSLGIVIGGPLAFLSGGYQFARPNNEIVKQPLQTFLIPLASLQYIGLKIDQLLNRALASNDNYFLQYTNTIVLMGASIGTIGLLTYAYYNDAFSNYQQHFKYVQKAQILTDSDGEEH